jgi:hypothetical protein
MSIDEQGFLSPDITAWIDKHRAENRAWFALATNLNSIAQRELLLLEPAAEDNEAIVAAQLFVRGLSSFQAAILLAERGMVLDARTITRSCFETVFLFGALHKDRGFLEKFEQADVHNKKTFANAQLAGRVKLLPEAAETLTQFLEDLGQSGEKGRPLNLKEVADAAGLRNEYDVYYRGLSNDAAHPSLIALKRYCEVDANNELKGLRWGPDVKDVEETLVFSCTACVYLVAFMAERLGHAEITQRWGRCWEEFKRLIEVRKAAAARVKTAIV